MLINQALINATQDLKLISPSARLDAELLLAHILACDRAYLFAHSEKTLSISQKNDFDQLLNQRQQGKPIAYLIGQKAFWDLELKITEQVLIPRPETEQLVDKILMHFSPDIAYVMADLGTGSGAIALALAKARPNWQIYATDISPTCLELARSNAQKYQLNNVFFFQGDWLSALPSRHFHCIVANPPYIAMDDQEIEAGVRQFEPALALFAQKQGYQALEKIIATAPPFLFSGGYLLLEHGHRQGKKVRKMFVQHQFTNILTYPCPCDFTQERFTMGVLPLSAQISFTNEG